MAPSVRFEDVSSQRDALEKIAGLIRKGSVDPRIIAAVRAITRSCEARDDICELQAIFHAVKHGDDRVSWLRDGLRYIADPHSWDTFSTAPALIQLMSTGSGAGDCDDHTILVGSLAAAAGFKVGARAYGRGRAGDYQHVYAVALVPKSGPWPRGYYGHALDTTVPRFDMGDEPEGGHIMTAWLTGD